MTKPTRITDSFTPCSLEVKQKPRNVQINDKQKEQTNNKALTHNFQCWNGFHVTYIEVTTDRVKVSKRKKSLTG